ncbi:hypothetical protein GCM10010469_33100 [Streptomyces labedae]|uniref:Uncharacterized protein n=1 Tax=Streptomyces labedae TaxID=285569 RepID=A0ABP6R0I2_9ACTN
MVTRSLVHVHTLSTHGESDARISNRSPTPADYAPTGTHCTAEADTLRGRGELRDKPR